MPYSIFAELDPCPVPAVAVCKGKDLGFGGLTPAARRLAETERRMTLGL